MKELPLSERLALIRTRLSLERTQMAWLRTAIAMITFGFTLYKAIQYARQLGIRRTGALLSASSFALIMIIIGLVSLVAATIQGIRHARALRAQDVELPVISEATMLAI